jgi:hypothetical protein
MLAPGGFGVDVLLAERADALMGRLLQNGCLTVLASQGVCVDLLFAGRTLDALIRLLAQDPRWFWVSGSSRRRCVCPRRALGRRSSGAAVRPPSRTALKVKTPTGPMRSATSPRHLLPAVIGRPLPLRRAAPQGSTPDRSLAWLRVIAEPAKRVRHRSEIGGWYVEQAVVGLRIDVDRVVLPRCLEPLENRKGRSEWDLLVAACE